MKIECFILLLIMMNSTQGLDDRDRDIDEFIKQEKDNPNFDYRKFADACEPKE